jgi:tetratricopeptide (TPR) repeat protein
MKRLLVVALLGLASVAAAQPDVDRLRAAKELVFDKKYAEARAAWQQVLSTAQGADAETAAYWVARCSESLGESERALREYGQFLDRKPADRTLAEEARTSRIGLAARLVKSGQRQHLAVLTGALSDPGKTVRYYGALQLSGLGKELGMPALPVLKEIVAREKDEDLVERAKLGILRLDPGALASTPGPAPAPRHSAVPRPSDAPSSREAPGARASWIRVRIYKKGADKPEVSINLPLALAELVFKSLPDDAIKELKREGYDAKNFWERLMKMPPSEILSIEGDDGERVQIWLE